MPSLVMASQPQGSFSSESVGKDFSQDWMLWAISIGVKVHDTNAISTKEPSTILIRWGVGAFSSFLPVSLGGEVPLGADSGVEAPWLALPRRGAPLLLNGVLETGGTKSFTCDDGQMQLHNTQAPEGYQRALLQGPAGRTHAGTWLCSQQ